MKSQLVIVLFSITTFSVAQMDTATIGIPASGPSTLTIEEDGRSEMKANRMLYKKSRESQEQLDMSNAMLIFEGPLEVNLPIQPELVYMPGPYESDVPVTPDTSVGSIRGPSQFDSRVEIHFLKENVYWQRMILQNARSVGIVVEKEQLHKVTDSLYQLDISATLGQLHNLCPAEPFRDQPVIGTGSAFIVDKNIMITAAHVFMRPLRDYCIVFDFKMHNSAGGFESLVKASNVYFPQRAIYRIDGVDLCAFSIDRTPERSVLAYDDSRKAEIGELVYMIGYPMGLPEKVALNADIASIDGDGNFYTTLDAFQGNSGSPVFSMRTHNLIGVLVSGGADYRWTGSCNAATFCRIPFCQGEKTISLSGFFGELNDVRQHAARK